MRTEHSAGAVLYTVVSGEPRYVLVTERSGYASLPKGHLEEGEPPAQAALRVMTQDNGNPSSLHHLGGQAAKEVAGHRAEVAAALGCKPDEIYFTSCGTEGDNWAISLAVHLGRHKGKHIITTAVEHAAVLEPC